jgi:hypothetical protein
MSMSPITQTVQGRSLTFLLSMTSLNAVLTTDELNRAFMPQARAAAEAIIRSPSHQQNRSAA